MYNFEFLFVCGDIHGEFKVIPDFLKKHDIKNAGVIVAGDFGIGFDHEIKERKKLAFLNERMNQYNSTLFAVRGNHDDPKYFHTTFDLSNVKLVPDYSVLNINKLNILCVGGAVSIDRTRRNSYLYGKGRDWWKGETIEYRHDIIQNLKDIDIVITHSSPDFAFPFIKGGLEDWSAIDIHLKSDVAHERNLLTNLYYALTIDNKNKIKQWFYGHYHNHHEMEHDQTKFICLDIDDFKEINLTLLNN